jgi:hypothetical protein
MMEMKSRGISNVGHEDSLERVESYPWSPTHEQVEDYIRSLELQVRQKNIAIPPRRAEEYAAAGRARRPFVFSHFFWGLITLVLGCFAWLVQIIYEGLK